jgi:ribosomal protein L28
MTSFIHTQDGTVLMFDAEIGLISARSVAEAQAELRRRTVRNLQSQKGVRNLNQPVTLTVGVSA